jgi:trk system potassium uptake protein TrkA
VGRKISELQLPKGAQVGLIMRGLPELGEGAPPSHEAPTTPAKVIIARSDTVIESNDHIVVFVPRKRQLRDVEKLFRVSATFF